MQQKQQQQKQKQQQDLQIRGRRWGVLQHPPNPPADFTRFTRITRYAWISKENVKKYFNKWLGSQEIKKLKDSLTIITREVVQSCG